MIVLFIEALVWGVLLLGLFYLAYKRWQHEKHERFEKRDN